MSNTIPVHKLNGFDIQTFSVNNGKRQYVLANTVGAALGYSSGGRRLSRLVRQSKNFKSGRDYLVTNSYKLQATGLNFSPTIPAGDVTLLTREGLETLADTSNNSNIGVLQDWLSASDASSSTTVTTFPISEESASESETLSELVGRAARIASENVSSWSDEEQSAFLIRVRELDREDIERQVQALDDYIAFAKTTNPSVLSQGDEASLQRIKTELVSGINMRHLTPAHLLDRGWKTPTDIAKDICHKHGIDSTKSTVQSVLHYLNFVPYQNTENSFRYITKAEIPEQNGELVLVHSYFYGPEVAKLVEQKFVQENGVDRVTMNALKRAGKMPSTVTLEAFQVARQSTNVTGTATTSVFSNGTQNPEVKA